MVDAQIEAILGQLDKIIDEEREALLRGQLDSIADILGRKEALIDALAEVQPHDRSRLERLQSNMERNQTLFDQALEGIRNVSDRLNALRRLRKSLDTYDASGRKTDISEPSVSRLERRA